MLITARRSATRFLLLFALIAAQLTTLVSPARAATLSVDANTYWVKADSADPVAITAWRYDGDWDPATSVALHETDPETGDAAAEVADAIANVVVDEFDPTVVTFDLVAPLSAGPYVLRYTSGTDTGETYLYAEAPYAYADPSNFFTGYTAPAAVQLTGVYTAWEDGVTDVTVHPTSWESGTGPAIPSAASNVTVTGPDTLSFDLDSLGAGEYVIRTTTGNEVADASLYVQDPWAYLDASSFLGSDLPQSTTAYGYGTEWSEATTLTIHAYDWDAEAAGDAIPLAASIDAVVDATTIDLTINAGLAEGYYIARFTTGSSTADAWFDVAVPQIYIYPEFIANTTTTPITVWVGNNGYTDFEAGPLTVELLDGDTVVLDATGATTVDSPWQLSFDLAELLPNGIYTVRVSVDGQVLSAPLTFGDPEPWAYVDPWELAVGYEAPVTMSVWGQDTHFTPDVTQVTIVDGAGVEFDGAAGPADVTSANDLTFPLLTSLPEGDYAARMVTETESVDAWFSVVRSAYVNPSELTTGHPTPYELTFTGAGTAWDETTTVTVHDDWDEVVAGALGTPAVTSTTSMSVDLLAQLPAGYYRLEITTGDLTENTWLYIYEPYPEIAVSPQVLRSGFSPTTITVTGTHTAFDDTTSVRLIDWSMGGEDVPNAVSDVVVLSGAELTFTLASLPDGYYDLVVTTADSEVWSYLYVTGPYAWANPYYLRQGYPDTTITLHGELTAWDETSTVTLLDGSGNPTGSLTATRPIDASTIEVDLASGLQVGGYLLRVTTGSDVEDAWFSVYTPQAWAYPNVLPLGYSTQQVELYGWGSTWQQSVTSIDIRNSLGQVVRVIDAADTVVDNSEYLWFSLQDGLPGGDYTLRTVTGSDVVDAHLSIVQPHATISPSGLETGYATPRRIDVWGTATSFDGSTTVQVLDAGGAPVAPAAVGTVTVSYSGGLAFTLTRSLGAGSYTVRVTTGGEVVDVPLTVSTPRARTTSSTGSTSVRPDGTVAVSIPRGAPSPLTVQYEPVCPSGQTLDGVVLHQGGTDHPMAPVAAGSSTWSATVPADQLVAGPFGVTVTCDGIGTDEALGEIVLYDPSGIVSDSVSGLPVVGASVSLFKVPGWSARVDEFDDAPNTCQSNESKLGGPWNQEAPTSEGELIAADSPEIDPHINPQTTNSIGYYGWDVAAGCWYVVVSKAGYETLVSPVVGVPSEVTDLDLTLIRLPDTEAPAFAGGAALTSSELTSTSVKLSWPAASDDTGVDAYDVLRDGVVVASLPATARDHTVTGLSPSTAYTFGVEARDVTGNTSTRLTELVTTAAAPGGGTTGGTTDGGTTGSTTGGTTSGTTTGGTTDGGTTGSTTDGGTATGGTTDGGTATGGTTDGGTATGGTATGGSGSGGASDGGAATGSGGTTPAPISRTAGTDRFSTAVALSKAYAPGVPVVYIATGRNFADALAGGPAAAAGGGPVLLVEPTMLPEVVAQELARLEPGRIVILGGEKAVSADVARALAPYTTGEVTRLFGATRYETAAAISKATFTTSDVVYIATGENFPDALAAGALAAKAGGSAMLLTQRDVLPEATIAELQRLKPTRIVIAGGEGVVSKAVAEQLATFASVQRLSGPSRYHTAAAISGTYAAGAQVVYVATGENYPDALASIPTAGPQGAPLVLVRPNEIPDVTRAELSRLAPKRIVILGGPNAVSPEVEQALQAHITP